MPADLAVLGPGRLALPAARAATAAGIQTVAVIPEPRAAAGLNAGGVISTGDVDPWHPNVLRGSAGLHFALPVARADSLDFAGELIAFDADGDLPTHERPRELGGHRRRRCRQVQLRHAMHRRRRAAPIADHADHDRARCCR